MTNFDEETAAKIEEAGCADESTEDVDEIEPQTQAERLLKEEWPEPIPFTNYDSLPDFPVECLPDWGQRIVKSVSEVNQVDMGLVGTIYLAILAACIGKKAEIDLISHKEPVNIYTVAILPVGERKSRTLNILTDPLYQYQKIRQEEMFEIVRQATNSHKIREAKLARLQKRAAHTDNSVEAQSLEQEADDVSKEIAENPVPVYPTTIADDITIEKLGDIMSTNNERLAILSTEGGSFFGILAGRYNDGKSNLDLCLKAHSGDPYSCYRIGREPLSMDSPSLTICLTVQPDIIFEIGINNHFRGRGLLARFLLSHCKTRAGSRQRQVKSIPDVLLSEYGNRVKSLLDISLELKTIKLSPEGQALWDSFYNDVESEMRPGGDLEYLKDWGSKLPGAVARIAGLLHFAEYGAEAVNKNISVGIVGDSCAIGGYFKEHAIAAFGLMQADDRIEFAKLILDYILRHKPITFKGRDILNNKNAFKSMDDISHGLKILIERGYIGQQETEYSGKGRPRAAVYEVNPKIKYA